MNGLRHSLFPKGGKVESFTVAPPKALLPLEKGGGERFLGKPFQNAKVLPNSPFPKHWKFDYCPLFEMMYLEFGVCNKYRPAPGGVSNYNPGNPPILLAFD